jgi:dihydroorotate dehydrogenase electron transfer subunit
MEIRKITGIVDEARDVKTFMLDKEVRAMPGQFVMVWIPDVGEKPFSLAYSDGNLGITALLRGPFTKKLHEMKVGELLGIRGPYGRGFEINGNKLLLVGGGVGMPPLAALADKARADGKDVTVIVGARTKSSHLFLERMEKAGARVLTCTDDGSCGTKGLTIDVLGELLKKETFDECFTCGPEIMMQGVMQITGKSKIPTQASIERYFKCGIGVCSHCTIDYTGARVCMEGPVFTDKDLENGEFGKYSRDATGRRVYFKA